MTNKLKPCPFCGEEAKLDADILVNKFFVRCPNCGIGTMRHTHESAIERWNNRKKGSASLIETLQELVDGSYAIVAAFDRAENHYYIGYFDKRPTDKEPVRIFKATSKDFIQVLEEVGELLKEWERAGDEYVSEGE